MANVTLPEDDEPDEFILSVIYNQTPTHHIVKRTSDSQFFMVNGRLLNHCRTLPEVRDPLFSSPHRQ